MRLSTHRGLVLAEHDVSEDAVQAELRSYDDRLLLSKEFDATHQCWVYVVVRYMGSEHPARHICDWRDPETNEPLPLTLRLVEKANSLRLGSRAPQVDPEAENEKLRAERLAEFEVAATESTKGFDDYLRWGPKTITPAGLGLAAARRRERRKGFNV